MSIYHLSFEFVIVIVIWVFRHQQPVVFYAIPIPVTFTDPDYCWKGGNYYEMPFLSINSPCQNVVGNPRKGKEVLKTFVHELCGNQAPENGIIFILPPDLASMMPMIAQNFASFWPLGYPNVTSRDCLDWRWEES